MDLFLKTKSASKRTASSSAEVRIFVRTPKDKTIAVMVNPSELVVRMKLRIQREAMLPSSGEMFPDRSWYPFQHQRLSYLGRRLEDNEILASRDIPEDSTLQLTMDWIACTVTVKMLPSFRYLDLEVKEGLKATIGDVKVLISEKEGTNCKELYLGDRCNERLGDDVTLEACQNPKRNLVWIQSPTTSLPPSPCSSSPQNNRRRAMEAFEDMFTREYPSQVSSQVVIPNFDVASATVQQSHEDCNRIISQSLDGSSKLQVDSQLKSTASLPSLALDEKQMLEQELAEHQSKFARELCLLIDEKNNLCKQLSEFEKDYQQQLLDVLGENNKLHRESSQLQNELDTVKAELRQEKEQSLCTICFDRPRDTLVLACLHSHFCSQCLEMHQRSNSTCPTCRGVVSGKLLYRLSM